MSEFVPHTLEILHMVLIASTFDVNLFEMKLDKKFLEIPCIYFFYSYSFQKHISKEDGIIPTFGGIVPEAQRDDLIISQQI